MYIYICTHNVYHDVFVIVLVVRTFGSSYGDKEMQLDTGYAAENKWPARLHNLDFEFTLGQNNLEWWTCANAEVTLCRRNVSG